MTSHVEGNKSNIYVMGSPSLNIFYDTKCHRMWHKVFRKRIVTFSNHVAATKHETTSRRKQKLYHKFENGINFTIATYLRAY